MGNLRLCFGGSQSGLLLVEGNHPQLHTVEPQQLVPLRRKSFVLGRTHDEPGDPFLQIGLPGFQLALYSHGHALFHAVDQTGPAKNGIPPYSGGKRCIAVDPGQEQCPYMLSNHGQHALPLRLHRVKFFDFSRIALWIHFEQVAPGVRVNGGCGFFGQGAGEIGVLLQ